MARPPGSNYGFRPFTPKKLSAPKGPTRRGFDALELAAIEKAKQEGKVRKVEGAVAEGADRQVLGGTARIDRDGYVPPAPGAE